MPAILLIVAAIIGVVLHHEFVQRRIHACVACQIEMDGGGRASLGNPHTCSKSRTPYINRRGDVYEFGRRVRKGDRAA